MKIRTFSILLIYILVFGVNLIGFCDNENLPKEDIEKIIEDVATKRGIPSVILKSIAKTESSLAQFNRDGTPKVSRGGHIGIMQVSRDSGYNIEKLKYDPVYNVEIGADMLLRKWRTANEKMAQIGNMDPNILEHWYFALWGYNGLIDRNNPNVKENTYQHRIYEIALKDYGQKITPIDKSYIPKKGWPKKDVKIPTPEEYHEGDILKYSPDDRVKIDGRDILYLHDNPGGKGIGEVKGDYTMIILEGPVLNGGFYFYKIKVEQDARIGWVYGNWISKIQ